MQTQFDNSQRVVAVSNLEAMCARISGTCHRYEVTKVTRSRVHVTYSNPNEYGSEFPMIAVFPCYPSGNDTINHTASPCVVLDITRVIGDNWNGEGWQAFMPLLECPTLFRSPAAESTLDFTWKSHKDIRSDDPIAGSCTSCVKCDLDVNK